MGREDPMAMIAVPVAILVAGALACLAMRRETARWTR